MRKGIAFFAMFVTMISCRQGVELKDSYIDVRAKFENPPMEYRSSPLWVWNNKMTNQIIEEQLSDFKDKGIGGVFVHPRPGLITPYLSREWFALFRHAVEVGKKLGMKVWIYDENSYPSGFAGGNVPDQMPEAAEKMIELDTLSQIPDTCKWEIVSVFQKEGDMIKNITSDYKNIGKNKSTYLVFRLVKGAPSPWFGGFTYVEYHAEKSYGKIMERFARRYGGECVGAHLVHCLGEAQGAVTYF